MSIKTLLKLIISIAVPLLAGVIGSFFTAPAIQTWYTTLEKPALNPPSWIFAPVWTALFLLMGIAAFIIWKRGLEQREVKIALGIFLFQLVLNTLWSILFFGSTSLTIYGLNNIGIAFAEIIILWVAILATIISFAKISRAAAWLLVPYILWVSFAMYLNYSFWMLN